MHFASYYRWIVATRYWGLPLAFTEPLLDIGAGDGKLLSNVSAPYRVGIDLIQCPQVDFFWVQADARWLPFQSSQFGHIFAFDIIELVMEDAQLLAEVHRVLKPGGTLWLSTTGQFFTIFPGGAVERRLFRSWGHVRRGYSVQMFLERLPEGLRVAEIFEWNELFFRSLYIPLKVLSQLLPSIVYRLLNLIAACDALHRRGESGHLFIQAVRID